MSKFRIHRRTFLKIMGALPASLYLAACSPNQSPTPESAVTPIVNPPGPVSSIVGIVKADSYDRTLVRQQVQAALDAIGGIGDIVKPGASVAIKVNLTGGTCCTSPHKVSRAESYWTHPEVVRALGELLRDAGATKLYIVEGLFTANSFAAGGYEDIARSIDAVLVDLNNPAPYASFAKTAVGKGWFIYENFEFNPVLDNVDVFVSVPKMKCHLNCGVTASMKNLVGLGPMPYYCVKPDDNNRTAFHGNAADTKNRLPRVVVDLNRARPIHLALVDGITTTDGGEGPWITPTHLQSPHILIAGKNAVATDAVATAVMGFDPTAEYPARPFLRGDNHLSLARGLGLGTNRLDEITVKGIASLDEVRQQFASS